ncbi:hypothetical protein [Niveispirillum fermenti]|uniref:hypothetical protein n=1 Tax=Niveispirillum fermenti TaxID=1233113 RepID=UPI003A85B04B
MTVTERLAEIAKQEAALQAQRRELKDQRVREIGKAFEHAGLLELSDAELDQVITYAKDVIKTAAK